MSTRIGEQSKAVHRLAAIGHLNREQLDEVVSAADSGDQVRNKSDLLELILNYVRRCLADHDLTDNELHNVRQLKRLFRIAEGDFTTHAADEVAELLATQLARALADKQIDNREAVQKVRLQEAFSLGYDEFLELTRPLFDDVMAQLWEEGVVRPLGSHSRSIATAITVTAATAVGSSDRASLSKWASSSSESS